MTCHTTSVCYDCMATDANGPMPLDERDDLGTIPLHFVPTGFVGFGTDPACDPCDGHFGTTCDTCGTMLAGHRFCVTVVTATRTAVAR